MRYCSMPGMPRRAPKRSSWTLMDVAGFTRQLEDTRIDLYCRIVQKMETNPNLNSASKIPQ